MNEEDALLAAIYANHDEDTPRLVYADWLDEHGRHEEAEFIRLPFELAHHESYTRSWTRIRDRVAELEAKYRDQWLPGLDADGKKKRVRLWFGRGMLEVVRIEHGIPADYLGLASLPGVREVCITDSTLTEEAVRDIATFDQLDELSVWRTPFQAEWLELLDCLPPWTAVEIDSDEPGFAQAWEAFHQRRCARLSLAPAERVRQMLRRRLGEEWKYRVHLPPGPILRGLLREPQEFDLLAISCASELEHLHIFAGQFSESGLRSVAALPKLRSVEIDRSDVESLTPLTTCTLLERLHVTTKPGFLPPEGIEGTERLSNLRELFLDGGPGALRDDAFRRLAPLKQLRSLELRFGELKKDSFSVLAGLPKLEILKLDGLTRDEDVRHFAGLTNLTCLVLTASCVTDAALRHLSRLTKLHTLFVRGGQSQVTEVAARQLAATLPDVTLLLDCGVVKSPRTKYVLHRRLVGKCASLLCPVGWAPPDHWNDDARVGLKEAGWEHVDSRLDDRSAWIGCYNYGHASNTSAEDELAEYLKAHREDSQVLERSVISFAGADSASCVIEKDEDQELLCRLNIPDDHLTLTASVARERFEEFRPLFLYIARSLRVGADALVDVGEEITVPVSEL